MRKGNGDARCERSKEKRAKERDVSRTVMQLVSLQVPPCVGVCVQGGEEVNRYADKRLMQLRKLTKEKVGWCGVVYT